MISDKKRIGYVEGILSIVINSVLFGFKLWVGKSSGSVAMVADAWHTISDTLTSIVVIFGFWISSRPGDDRHPYGHGRAELIGSIVIGVLLGVVGVNFFRDSLVQLSAREAADFRRAGIIVFAASVVFKESIAQFSIRMGKRHGSASLIADGWHHRSDAVASALILVGSLFGKYLWWIDGALGICVSLLIVFVAFEIIRDSSSTILGESPSTGLEDKLRAVVAAATPEVTDVHSLEIHRYGDRVMLTMHVRMKADTPLEHAHETASRLEKRLLDDLGFVATIHLEPKS